MFYSILALIRDHDPQCLLSEEEYDNLRRESSKDLKIKYTSPPPASTNKTGKVSPIGIDMFFVRYDFKKFYIKLL